MRDAGARAMRLLLARIERGAPWPKAFRQLDYWLPIGSQCTMMAPMRPVMERRAAIAAETGVAELAFCFGFPYADFHDCGPAIAAVGEGARDAVDALFAELVAREESFVQHTMPSEQAVAEAIRLAAAGKGPVVLADTQDNPGGGGHGDTTELLGELVRQGAKGAVMCLINDRDSVETCAAAGVGAFVSLSLGGKSDGAPLVTAALVERLTDGDFTLTGPMGAGNPANLGPMALIDINGVKVIVTGRKMQAHDQSIIRHVGIEPADCSIIALKSSVHFRADFTPIAGEIIVAIAPGPVVADPGGLNFRHVRAEVRRRPRLARG
jgi:microcystin degradation protein MlrC